MYFKPNMHYYTKDSRTQFFVTIEKHCPYIAVSEPIKIIGYAYLQNNIIYSLFIDKEYRNNGVASKLIKYIINEKYDDPIEAFVDRDNSASERAFLKAGFKINYKKCNKYRKWFIYYNEDEEEKYNETDFDLCIICRHFPCKKNCPVISKTMKQGELNMDKIHLPTIYKARLAKERLEFVEKNNPGSMDHRKADDEYHSAKREVLKSLGLP